VLVEEAPLSLRGPTKCLAAGAATAGLLLAEAAPAWATSHSVRTWANGGHVLQGSGSEYEGSGSTAGLEYWYDLRTSESTQWWDTVCNYQSYLAEIGPSGSVYFTQYSSRHSGCTLLFGLFHWPNWESWYLEDTKFRCKWDSDDTVDGAWQVIGDLRD
jgi:hypothetical protein